MGSIAGITIMTVGIVGMILNKNVVMKVISLDVMNVGVVFFFVSIGYRSSSVPPIVFDQSSVFADPIPQAVIITAIVIGFSILSLSVAITAMLIEETKRVNTDDMERLMKS